MIDEVQQIQDWEKTAASLNGDGFTRVVLSGSNSFLLSGDLATHIAGRYLRPRQSKEAFSSKAPPAPLVPPQGRGAPSRQKVFERAPGL